jgi:hypothetical protein
LTGGQAGFKVMVMPERPTGTVTFLFTDIERHGPRCPLPSFEAVAFRA